MDAIETILCLSRDYADASSLTLRQVSWRVFGDTNKVDQLVSGGDLTTRRFSQAVVWFSANWPEGLAWPSGVHRPDPHLAAPSSDDGENGAGAASCHVESASAIPHAELAR